VFVTYERHPPIPADPASHEPPPARPTHCGACGAKHEEDRTDRRIRMLDRMAELGMERLERRCAEDREEAEARRRVGQVTGMILTQAQRDSRDAGEVMFQQTTRANRLCMALAEKFENDRSARERQDAAEREADEKQHKARRKDHLERLVKEAIEQHERAEAERADGSELDSERARIAAQIRASDTEYLTKRVSERLTEKDIERDVAHIPFSELVERLCREMDIEPPWEIWEDQPWAQEEARLGIKGSPYVKPRPPEPAPTVKPAGSDHAVGTPEPPSG
jgi:hypothetical protein